MSTALKSASAEASVMPGNNSDLMATQLDPRAKRHDAPYDAAASAAGSAAELSGASWGPGNGTTPLRNITVLPKVEGAGVEIQFKPRAEARYQRVKHLGAGAMGEVNLAQEDRKSVV